MVRRTIISILVLGVCLWGFAAWAHDDWIMETDNHDATFTGTWGTSTARILYYGDNYRYATCSGSTGLATATATFLARTTVDIGGYYTVFARWVVDPNRSIAAPYDIYEDSADATPMATVFQNQEGHGGEWWVLGTYFFHYGKRPKVVLKNNCAAEANGAYVIADAIRWVKENIGAADIVDEPGIDYAHSANNITIASTSTATPTQVISKSLTCPRSGYVVAMASGGVAIYSDAAGNFAEIIYSLSKSTAHDSNYEQYIGGYASNPGGNMWGLFIQRMDTCSSGTTLTYYLLASRIPTATASASIYQPTLTLMYFPTQY